MTDDLMGYHGLVEDAMRGVVRAALEKVAAEGLPGGHHFYITFRTTDPGVVISDRLRAQYPEEMTIVIQHQFWGLEAARQNFRVTLSFGGVSEALTVPFTAIVGFVDPAVSFGLQFGGGPSALKDAAPGADQPAEAAEPENVSDTAARPEGGDGGEVVRLDRFRKK